MKIQKLKILLGVIILVLFISYLFLRVEKDKAKSELYKYLPALIEYKVRNIKVKKIYADASYKMPYILLISFKSQDHLILKSLGLKNVQMVDTLVLKISTWPDEYDLYFTMHSLNALRYRSIKDEQDHIRWWKVGDCKNIYAAPYVDKMNRRRIVKFGEKKNGRIAGCKLVNNYYVLIECWG